MASEEGNAGNLYFDLAFKNPSRPLNDTYTMQCPNTVTIGQLKEMLQQSYPGNPSPDAVTVSSMNLFA